MREYCFSFRSVTAAQRGLHALAGAGIPASMTRTPVQLAKNGCGYCLQVSPDRAGAAAKILRGAGVQGVWVRRGERYEEAADDLL